MRWNELARSVRTSRGCGGCWTAQSRHRAVVAAEASAMVESGRVGVGAEAHQ